jgi:hypothetical protein
MPNTRTRTHEKIDEIPFLFCLTIKIQSNNTDQLR